MISFSDIWQQQPKLLLVTGEIGAGKTTWTRDFIDYAHTQQANISGLLSPAIFENGVKTGITLLNLTTGEQRQLARLRTNTPASISTQRWTFDNDVLAWGDNVLSNITSADLLIIDEIGPLELEKGEGWQSALTLLDAVERYRSACVIIRSNLLPVALERWPHAISLTIQPEKSYL